MNVTSERGARSGIKTGDSSSSLSTTTTTTTTTGAAGAEAALHEVKRKTVSSNRPISRGNVSIDPTTLAVNECMAMVSAMRRSNRWAQGGVAALLNASDIFGTPDDDEGLTSNLGISSILNNQSEKGANYNGSTLSTSRLDNPLLSSFLQLKSILTESKTIFDIDSLTLLQPFLLVIKLSSTSGYITGLALNAVSKFLTYDVISLDSKNINASLAQIVSALTHCRFEAADQNSDDAVLLKVLRLLEKLVESLLVAILTNESVSEIVHTCLSLACNKRRSEVLRRAAEMAMMSITVEIFSKLKELEPETDFSGNDLQTNFSNTVLPDDVIGGTETKASSESSSSPSSVNGDSKSSMEVEKHNAEEHELVQESFDDPFGIVCINEFLGILVSFISPTNQHQHMESTRVFALTLINTAVEVSGSELPKYSSLLTMIADPVSKHVLQIITTTDSTPLLKASLQVFSTISIVLGSRLKPQFELSIRLIMKALQPEPISNDKTGKKISNQPSRTPIAKELLLESLSLLWTRSPEFFTRMFINYDCDFEKSDLAADFIKFLAKQSLPEAAITLTHNVPPLCLDGLLTLILGMNERSKVHTHGSKSELSKKYLEKRRKKTAFINCTELLNENPKEGVKLLAKEGFISDDKDYEEVANFFFSKSARLNKKMLGEFLAKPKNSHLLDAFISLFDFRDLRVDEALRILLKTFRLPGESQQIERIVEKFAERYVSCQENSDSNQVDLSTKSPATKRRGSAGEENDEAVRPDKDSVFILSYSVIMLNTDLHNPQVKRQMLLEDYKRNLRGVYNGKDFPEWYLSKIYSSIKDREIIMPEEHHGTDKWFDDVWHNVVSTQDFSNETHDEFDAKELCHFDSVLLQAIVDDLISTLMVVYQEASDDHIVTRLMSSVDKVTSLCLIYNIPEPIDTLTIRLVQFSNLARGELRKGLNDDNIREEIPITQLKIEKKDGDIFVSDLSVWFGRDFKAQLAAVMLFRLMKKSGCRVTKSWDKVVDVILNLFENCLIDPNMFGEFQKKIQMGPLPKVQPLYHIKKSKPLNNSGLLSTFSSFLKGYNDEPPEPTDVEIEATLSSMDCVKTINVPNIFAIVSKSDARNLMEFISLFLASIPKLDEKNKRFCETETLFILEACVCFCLLLNSQKIMEKVYDCLNEVNGLSKKGQLRLTTYKLLLLRYYENENSLLVVLKTLGESDKDLMSKHGGQILQPLLSLLDDDCWCYKKLLVDDNYWNTLRYFGSLQVYAFDIIPFLESFVANSREEITPANFVSVLGLMDEISSLGAIGSQFEHESEHNGGKLAQNSYYNDVMGMAKKSIELTSRLAPLLTKEQFQQNGLAYSFIQALAHQCFNPCREVRDFAVKTLQASTTSMQLNKDMTFQGVFEFGYLPLLSELSKVEVYNSGRNGFQKTRNEVVSLISKAFLKNLDNTNLDDVKLVWIKILDGLLEFQKNNGRYLSPELTESTKETLKNMILVLQANKVIADDTNHDESLKQTVEKIRVLYPSLAEELGLVEKKLEVAETEETKEKPNMKNEEAETEKENDIEGKQADGAEHESERVIAAGDKDHDEKTV